MEFPPMCVFLYLSLIINVGTSSAQGSSGWHSCKNDVTGTGSFYRPETEACCQGRILVKTKEMSELCCGGELYDLQSGNCCGGEKWYDTSSQFCCFDTVYNLDGQTECCRGQLIDTTAHTCCQDRLVAGTGKCCGVNAVFDSQTQLCCEGPDEVGRVHTIGSTEVINDWMECCNMEAIDTRVQHCCNMVPQQKTNFSECCGPETLDVRTQTCCVDRDDYKISPMVEGRNECCGLEPINTDNEQCCESEITFNIGNGLCCESSAYNPLRSSCCYHDYLYYVTSSVPEILDVQACCSGQSFLKTDQVCCSGRLHDIQPDHECCGTELYDYSRQLCCSDGNPIDKTSPSSQCCGDGGSFEHDRQTCCEGQVLNVVNGSCCRTGEDLYEAYSSLENKCCSRGRKYGKVHSRDVQCCGTKELKESHLCNRYERLVSKQAPLHDKVCCNPWPLRCDTTYNSNTQFCFKGKVKDRRTPTPGVGLCGVQTYRIEDKQCCNGHLQPKTLPYYMFPLLCCGTNTYSPEVDVCHEGKRHNNIPEKYAEICRNQPYDNRTDECDPTYSLIRPISERLDGLTHICESNKPGRGYYPYNPTKHQCCGDMLIGPEETCCYEERLYTPGTGVGEGQCCDAVGFNPNTHTCCDDFLHEVVSDDYQCCGRKLFDPASTVVMCCNDHVMSTEDGRTECTSGVAHSPTETVCDGVVYQVTNGDCCGKVVMITHQEICCQDKYLYNRATHGDTCCGKVAYDSSDPSEVCCSDTSLYHQASGSVCCQDSTYDPFKDVCQAVGDAFYIFPRQSNWVECSEGSYDPVRQTCCRGILYDIPGECCGNEFFREGEDQICCGSKKQDRMYGEKTICCGEAVWNRETHTCCGDKGFAKSHFWETCCDGVVMSKSACPKKEKNPLGSRGPSRLGPSMCGGRLYNASEQGCCNEALYDPELYACTDGHLQPLCTGTPYDDSAMMCCADEIHSLETTGCCNGTPYNLSSPNVCCNNVLRRVRNGACCGPDSTPYSRNRNLCCEGTLRRKKKGRTECCGGFAINPDTDTCCGDTVTRGVSHGTCCGDKAFDPAEKMCCPEQGKLYKRRLGTEKILSDSLCCAAGMEYNTTAGTCVPKDCIVCKTPSSTKGWQEHTGKVTLIRGTVSNITRSDKHHLTMHLTRVSHLNREKQTSGLDFRVTVPSQCGCEELVLNKAYIIMSDEVIVWKEDFDHLTLRPTDFLSRAKDQLGRKIKHYICKHKD